MVTYDPSTLIVFAAQRYAQANRIVALSIAAGVIFGGLASLSFAAVTSASETAALFFLACGAGLFGLVGAVVGLDRAFAYKLDAQRTLCALQTEINTRTPATAAAIAAGMTSPGAPRP